MLRCLPKPELHLPSLLARKMREGNILINQMAANLRNRGSPAAVPLLSLHLQRKRLFFSRRARPTFLHHSFGRARWAPRGEPRGCGAGRRAKMPTRHDRPSGRAPVGPGHAPLGPRGTSRLRDGLTCSWVCCGRCCVNSRAGLDNEVFTGWE